MICPECQQGKHPNCDGLGGFNEQDHLVDCTCTEGEHPNRRFSTA